MPLMTEMSMDVRGRDLASGFPRNVKVTSTQIEEAIKESINKIVDIVKLTLEKTPPELASDIMNQGIYVSGGGAAFPKTAEWIKEEFKIPVHIADRPEDHVILGMQSYLKR